jgi:hypothetical protein
MHVVREIGMPKTRDDEIALLEQLEIRELRERWATAFGQAPPVASRRDLLLRSLAYRLQVERHGPIPGAIRKRLVTLATSIRDKGDAAVTAAPRIKPGTRLLRDWGGETHEVIMLDRGFSYRGERFRSLSEIARRITGTRWSGPSFFGLKGRATHAP